MLDYDFDGEVFDLDEVFYAEDLKKNAYEVRFDSNKIVGAKHDSPNQIMVIYIDIFGNEKREVKRNIKTQNYSTLITDLASLIEQGRKAAVRYVNTALVATYWFIGRRIVEYEQKGKERAEYGEALLKKISIDLTPRFGK